MDLGLLLTSKMECFVIIVNGWNMLTIIKKRSILDAAVALDPPLWMGQSICWDSTRIYIGSATFQYFYQWHLHISSKMWPRKSCWWQHYAYHRQTRFRLHGFTIPSLLTQKIAHLYCYVLTIHCKPAWYVVIKFLRTQNRKKCYV